MVRRCGRGRGGEGVGPTIAQAGKSGSEPDAGADGDREESGPLRRCFVSGLVRPKGELVRFVVSPDGMIVPDVACRLPGRGLWLTSRRDIVAAAVAKRLFGRAARAPVTAPDDLADRVDALLRRRCCDLIGLARRSGKAVAGFEKVRAALRKGEAAVLIAAADGGESGRDKVRALAPELPLAGGLSAAELGAAFGRDHVVHAVLGPGRLAQEFIVAVGRLVAYGATPTDLDQGRRRTHRRRHQEGNGTGTI